MKDASTKYLSKDMKKYAGYKTVDARKQTDSALIETMIKRLVRFSDELKRVHEEVIRRQLFALWDKMEYLILSLQSQIDAIRNTDYTGSTFFTSPQLEGLNLVALSATEAGIIKKINGLTVEKLGKAVNNGQSNVALTHIQTIMENIKEIESLYKERVELIRNFKKIMV